METTRSSFWEAEPPIGPREIRMLMLRLTMKPVIWDPFLIYCSQGGLAESKSLMTEHLKV